MVTILKTLIVKLSNAVIELQHLALCEGSLYLSFYLVFDCLVLKLRLLISLCGHAQNKWTCLLKGKRETWLLKKENQTVKYLELLR